MTLWTLPSPIRLVNSSTPQCGIGTRLLVEGGGVGPNLGTHRSRPGAGLVLCAPCPQSRPDAGELEEVPRSQTIQLLPGTPRGRLSEQKRELADSPPVCVQELRGVGLLSHLSNQVSWRRRGPWPNSWWPFCRSLSSEAGHPGALPGHLHVCLPLAWKAFPLGGRTPDIFALQIPKQRASSRLVYIC